MKYYLIAGEASGDLHGSKLIEALKKKDDNAKIRFWGGDLMEQAGGILVKHIKILSFMGFWEVVTHLRTILKNYNIPSSGNKNVLIDKLSNYKEQFNSSKN